MTLSDRKFHAMLLLLGTILLSLSQVRFGVGLLAFVAPVPFLIFLKRTSGWRSSFIFLGVICLAWTLASAKYITPPLPYFLILLNGVSFGLVNGIGYLTWNRLSRTLPSHLSNLAFASVLVSIEWLQYTFTPLASNGSAAYTQLENLPFLQMASLFGMLGISFIMYWFAAIVADNIIEKRLAWRQTSLVVGIIVLAHIGGAIRIGSSSEDKTVKVASVGTDSTWFGGTLPSKEERSKINNALFKHTITAATAGAKLVVWNEVSNFINPQDEPSLIHKGSKIATDHNIHLVMAYIVPIEDNPLKVENKYTWIGPQGELIDTYLKHKPVPGEPSIPGDGNAKVVETKFGKLSGAICFDFDFPQIGLDRAKKGATLVFLPSSDTKGVDPFHTQIAAIRAIEGGYSILRSTRMGLSAGIDPQGRLRSWLSSNETNERIMIVDLPTKSVWTLYSVIGDTLAYLSLIFTLFLLGRQFLAIFQRN